MPKRGIPTKEWIDALHADVPGLQKHDGKTPKAITWFHPHAKALVKLCGEHDVSVPEHSLQLMNTVILNAPSRRDIIDCLRRITVASFSEVRKAHRGAVRRAAAARDAVGEQTRAALRKFADRILTIRPNIIPEGENDDEKALRILEGVINFGIENVAIVSYSYFDVIPEAFHSEFGRDATPEEYLTIARTVLSTMLETAMTHDGIFRMIDGVLRRGTPQDAENDEKNDGQQKVRFFWQPFHAEDFALDGSTLLLSEDSVALIREIVMDRLSDPALKLHQPHVGCAGTELFPVVFECCLEAAKHSLFRHAERIRSLPRDLGRMPAFQIGQVADENSPMT